MTRKSILEVTEIIIDTLKKEKEELSIKSISEKVNFQWKRKKL